MRRRKEGKIAILGKYWGKVFSEKVSSDDLRRFVESP